MGFNHIDSKYPNEALTISTVSAHAEGLSFRQPAAGGHGPGHRGDYRCCRLPAQTPCGVYIHLPDNESRSMWSQLDVSPLPGGRDPAHRYISALRSPEENLPRCLAARNGNIRAPLPPSRLSYLCPHSGKLAHARIRWLRRSRRPYCLCRGCHREQCGPKPGRASRPHALHAGLRSLCGNSRHLQSPCGWSVLLARSA